MPVARVRAARGVALAPVLAEVPVQVLRVAHRVLGREARAAAAALHAAVQAAHQAGLLAVKTIFLINLILVIALLYVKFVILFKRCVEEFLFVSEMVVDKKLACISVSYLHELTIFDFNFNYYYIILLK